MNWKRLKILEVLAYYSMVALIFLFFGIVSGALSGCGSLPQALDANKTYRMDLPMEVGALKDSGTLVVPKAESYKIKVRPKVDPELVLLNSCHRETTLTNIDGTFTFDFTPTEVERKGFCPLEITVYAKRLWYQGGLLVTGDNGGTYPAKMVCNGKTAEYAGVSACQSKAGLIQKITFPGATDAGTPAKCAPPRRLSDNEFEIRPSSGQCAFLFRERVPPNREHVLTTIGYDEFIPPR